MSVTLRTRKTKKGFSYYLDICHDKTRRIESLGIYVNDSDNDKRAKKLKAETKKRQRENELFAGKNIGIGELQKGNFNEYFQYRIDKYEGKNKNRLKAILSHWKKFKDNREFVAFSEINPTVCRDFRAYLGNHLNFETPADYFKKFKRILEDATDSGYFTDNPARKVKNPNPVAGTVRKAVLTIDEVIRLSKTETQNMEIRRAFLFSCFTGLRYGDIKTLKWGSIDLENCQLSIDQQKTGKRLTVEFHQSIGTFLGFQRTKETLVFKLPSTANGVNKTLKAWAKRAGIDKTITFHVARHTFVTMVFNETDNLKQAGSYAGHSSIKHTEKYAHLRNDKRRKDLESLPGINEVFAS